MRSEYEDDSSDRTVRWTDVPSVSNAIVQTVADLNGLAPADPPPLYGVIDPDGLDQLFDAESEQRRPELLRVTYCRYEIELQG
jgi:hypothetical protein